MADQPLPIATALEDGTLLYGGVEVGEPCTDAQFVKLYVVNLESELDELGAKVLDQPGETGEILLSLGGPDSAGTWVYDCYITLLRPPEGPIRKYVVMGRLVSHDQGDTVVTPADR
jgi:hypothetical protein